MIDATLASGGKREYRFKLAAKGEHWMAIAVPMDYDDNPFYFAVNEEGDVHRSSQPIPLKLGEPLPFHSTLWGK